MSSIENISFPIGISAPSAHSISPTLKYAKSVVERNGGTQMFEKPVWQPDQSARWP